MNPSRVAVAGLFHETHTFLEGETSRDDFEWLEGTSLLARLGDSSPLGGALETMQSLNWEIVPLLDAHATPSATVSESVFREYWERFCKVSNYASAQRPFDALCLILHGAMCDAAIRDIEGEFLSRIRGLSLYRDLPVFCVLDLHANVSSAMAKHATGLYPYRENPHSDARITAVRAVKGLARALSTQPAPRTYFAAPSIMWPPPGTGTATDPMRTLLALARQLEAEHPNFWEVGVLGGFSFADTFDTGVSFTIVSNGPKDEARAALLRLTTLAHQLAPLGNVRECPILEALTKLDRNPTGLIGVVEPSDNIGGGAPGDGTGVLRAFIEGGFQNAAVCLWDPVAVAEIERQSIPPAIRLALGGRGSRLDAGPYALEVEVMSVFDGRFELEDKQSHLASAFGDYFDMGRCAVVRKDGVTILLTSKRTPPMDLGQWRIAGLAPEKFSYIGIKAAVAHRKAYDPITLAQVSVETPGPCSSRLELLPYKHVRRPIYPLDPLPTFDAGLDQGD